MIKFEYIYEFHKYFSLLLTNNSKTIFELVLANEKEWSNYETELNTHDVDYSKKIKKQIDDFIEASHFGYSYTVSYQNEYTNNYLVFNTNNHQINIYEKQNNGFGPKLSFDANDENLQKTVDLMKQLNRVINKPTE